MNTATYATMTDAIENYVLPTLGDMAEDYDIAGLAKHTVGYDKSVGAYRPKFDTERFLDTAVGFMLRLYIDWGHDTTGNRYADWSVESQHGAPVATGRVNVTNDNDSSFDIVEDEVTKRGFEMGDTLNIEPDWAEFCIQTV